MADKPKDAFDLAEEAEDKIFSSSENSKAPLMDIQLFQVNSVKM